MRVDRLLISGVDRTGMTWIAGAVHATADAGTVRSWVHGAAFCP